jgi:hypothetical protein
MSSAKVRPFGRGGDVGELPGLRRERPQGKKLPDRIPTDGTVAHPFTADTTSGVTRGLLPFLLSAFFAWVDAGGHLPAEHDEGRRHKLDERALQLGPLGSGRSSRHVQSSFGTQPIQGWRAPGRRVVNGVSGAIDEILHYFLPGRAHDPEGVFMDHVGGNVFSRSTFNVTPRPETP